jgi:O-antigen/teichoic acid export membrane protein
LTVRAAWMMFAKTLAFVFSFALPLLLVRRLDQREFGLYKQVFLFVNTAFALLPLGVGMSAFYFLPRDEARARQQQIVFNILLFHLFISGAVLLSLVLRPQILSALSNSAEMTGYAPLVGLVVLTWVASSSLEMIAIARGELKLATLFVISAQFTKAIFLLVAAILFATIESLLYAAIIQGVLQTVILVVYLRARYGQFWRGFEWPVIGMQLAYALPLGFASVLYRALLELDNYFVSYSFGPAAYAIYAVGCFELPLLGLLSDSIASVMIPRVSLLQKAGDRREIAELVARMMRKLSAVLLPFYAFLIVMGREFILVLFTAQYIESWPIFAINLTLVPLAIITSAYDPVIRAFAEHRYFLLRLRVVLLLLFIAALWFGLTRFGLLGAVVSMVSVNVIDRLVTARKVKNILGVTRKDLVLVKDVGKLALAAAAAGLATALVRSLILGTRPLVMLIVGGCVFALTYLVAVWALGVLTTNERGMIQHRLSRFQRHAADKRATETL